MKKKIWLTNFIFAEVEVPKGHCVFCHQSVNNEKEFDNHTWAKCLPEIERTKIPKECNESCFIKD